VASLGDTDIEVIPHLLIGLGEGEFLCGSDTPALAGFTRTILPMEYGEVALLTPLGIELKEIHEQPETAPLWVARHLPEAATRSPERVQN
jgi:glucosamine--fructose-6-phosphate aminotransferase (isomerizing)